MSHDEEEYLLREERAGMEDLMQSREQDIEELNIEVKEWKELHAALMKTYSEDTINFENKITEQEEEIQYLKARLDKIYRDKSKKICPIMSQTHVTKCRTDCMMWIENYCTVLDGLQCLKWIGGSE